MIRVLIAEDEEIVREGLQAIVDSDPGLRVVGTARDGSEAVAATRDLVPAVVLMDVRMPGMDGVEATRRIVSSGSTAKVLVLTTVDADDVVFAALKAGASGFLLKSVPRDKLYAGIRAVAAGEALLAPSVTRRLIEAHLKRAPRPSAPPMTLTARQHDVVRLVSRGMSNQEIAADLHLADTTVKGYVSDLLIEHHLRDRAQLVVLAYESGLIEAGGSSGTGARERD
jgi:DNA-binding NarL/FixJ family response regulator